MLQWVKDNKLKVAKYISIAIIALILAIKCGSIISYTKGLIKPSNIRIDTIKIETHDTIWPPKEPIQFKEIPVPKPYIVHDTVFKLNGKDTICTNVKVYQDSLDDKNITIRYKDYVSQGDLIGKDLNYTLKVPLRIVDSKTLNITTTDTLFKSPKYSINAGLSVGTQLLSPTVDFSIDRFTFQGGYNIQTKSPTIGIRYRLWSSKKR